MFNQRPKEPEESDVIGRRLQRGVAVRVVVELVQRKVLGRQRVVESAGAPDGITPSRANTPWAERLVTAGEAGVIEAGGWLRTRLSAPLSGSWHRTSVAAGLLVQNSALPSAEPPPCRG
jgi:hypothetical protein